VVLIDAWRGSGGSNGDPKEARLVQSVAVIAGKERRRRWSDEEKLRLAAETFAPGATVAQVARLHGVAESCLYTWRKQFAVGSSIELETAERPLLIPVMIDDSTPPAPAVSPAAARAVVTLADGTRLEVDAAYPASALKALIGALRPRR